MRRPGDTITISNPSTGFSRTITVGADGGYRFSQLPTGQYQISRNGAAPRNVTVNVGSAATVDFAGGDATTLDTVTVGFGCHQPDRHFVGGVDDDPDRRADQQDPGGARHHLCRPCSLGTVRGDAAFGNLASFGGASVAENQYYVNGFNVTNSFRSLNYSSILFEVIAEQQTKTGGYGAEFGRSLGGVVNQITKRGTNEFHAGGNVFWSPNSLRSDVGTPSNPLTPEYGDLRPGQLARHDRRLARANLWASGRPDLGSPVRLRFDFTPVRMPTSSVQSTTNTSQEQGAAVGAEAGLEHQRQPHPGVHRLRTRTPPIPTATTMRRARSRVVPTTARPSPSRVVTTTS